MSLGFQRFSSCLLWACGWLVAYLMAVVVWVRGMWL